METNIDTIAITLMLCMCAYAAVESSYFETNAAFQGLFCPAQDAETGIYESAVVCGHVCSNTDECHGFFYTSATRACNIRQTDLPDSSVCESAPGSRYFQRKTDCGAPATPINGNAVFTMTTFGASVNYTCDAGFDIIGVDTRTCNASGVWDGMPPSCVVVDCGPPATPANGNAVFTMTTFGAIVNYTCHVGYSLSGVDTRTCNASGLWSETEPVCVLDGCGILMDPTDGFVTCPSQQAGDNCTFACNVGFNLVGTSSVICQASGTWDLPSPTCSIVECGEPATPINGNVVFTMTTFGASVNYTCDAGFDIIGVDTRTCNASGVWDGMPPSCVVIGPVECEASEALVSGPNGVDNSSISASSVYSFDVGIAPYNARLDGPGAWSTAINDLTSWLQFDFSTQKTVTSVTTQGQFSSWMDAEWVTSYHVLHSATCAPDSFVTVKNAEGITQTFSGNSDTDGHVTNTFAAPILARCVRVNARTWDGWITMRVELYGC